MHNKPTIQQQLMYPAEIIFRLLVDSAAEVILVHLWLSSLQMNRGFPVFPDLHIREHNSSLHVTLQRNKGKAVYKPSRLHN